MKKKITFLTLLLLILLIPSTVEGKRQSYLKHIDASKLTSDEVWNEVESRNGNLIILETRGKVKDSHCNGSDELGYTKYHGVRKGDNVTSFFIFNPNTSYWDDVILRLDFSKGKLVYMKGV